MMLSLSPFNPVLWQQSTPTGAIDVVDDLGSGGAANNVVTDDLGSGGTPGNDITDPMTSAQIKKSIAAALSIGAVGIATALTALNNGDRVDCSLKAECQRTEENAMGELLCPTMECAHLMQDAYREISAECPDFKPSDCASLGK